ncbi:ASCH domain-containing protein [Vibrio alfacsensis]|uniref:ASCH domain-containing protein n=1 Tax=Vibrio alfacsensis TaxID=1074311 RepID=UPI001BEF77D2|nr:ASCH domain-containing protein [Vibrio alfacsensis]BCN23968.1 hypothetical protein VYA_11600 [Vibrio alfacsensis]
MDKITFFTKLERQILSGKKTATIRDGSESHYLPGQVVEAFTLEDDRKICKLEIIGITSNLRGIHNAWHFCFYFKFSVYGTMF